MRYAIILLSLSFNAFAGGYHHGHDGYVNEYTTNNYYETNNVTEVTELTEVTNITEVTETIEPNINESDISAGIALAIATMHPFSYLTNKWQGSINASRYRGESGLSFGIAKRFTSIDALFHSTVGRAGDDNAVTAGAVWRF